MPKHNKHARIATLDDRLKALEMSLATAILNGQRTAEKHIRRLIAQTLIKGLRV